MFDPPIPRRRLLGRMLAPMALTAGSLSPRRAAALQDATPAPDLSLEQQIQDLLRACESIYGVMIIAPDDEAVYMVNADVPFISASLYKLVLLAETLARVESKELSLDQLVAIEPEFYIMANGDDSYFAPDAIGYEATIEELTYATGAYSSNVAAQALISTTTRDSLEQFAQSLGMTQTRYWVEAAAIREIFGQFAGRPPSLDFVRSLAFLESFAGYGAVNLTTPRDVATFFSLLRDDRLVSPLISWQISHILEARVINDRIPALLPQGTAVIHKTGNLDGVLHDAGIVQTAKGAVIVVAMAQAATDYEMTLQIEQRLGLLAYQVGTNTAAEGQ
jgi:beta-lactamase class A